MISSISRSALVGRPSPGAGLVTARQTFVRRCHLPDDQAGADEARRCGL